MITIKRVYDEPDKKDGYRVLVDRLWPRGLSKDKVPLDDWLKDLSPSDDLRKWFGHDPKKWQEFKQKYKAELKEKKQALDQLRGLVKENDQVALLFAAKDTAHNNALVLKEVLEEE